MRTNLRPTFTIFAAAVLTCSAVFSCLAQQQADDEPAPLNIVWLSVEDMSPWINPYGDDTVPTPNLSKLAEEGVVYDNAFATSPVCAPARSSLITGMYATSIGSMHMRNGSRSGSAEPGAYDDVPLYEAVPPAFVRCFPEYLRAAGYYCTNNAKKDYQFNEPVTVWDESSNRAHWRNREDGQPFFAVFNHHGTHESRGFPARNQGQGDLKPEDAPVPPIYPDTANVRDAMARTYNNIAAMDKWVGDKMKELEDAGLLDNTVVIFFSDHGVGLPRGKRSCYDTGLRVPLIVRYPDGYRAGQREERVVEFVDFGPSVVSLAGISPDQRYDGVPFLGEHTRKDDGYAYAHADRFDSEYEQTRSISDGRFRYTRNLKTDVPYLLKVGYREQLPMTAELYALREADNVPAEQWQMAATTRPAEEFYDSENDPWETSNLIDDPAYAEKIAEMRKALAAWMGETGDLGLILPESKMVAEKLWPPDGAQPETPAAELQNVEDGIDIGEGWHGIALSCEEPGASIGYRLSTDGEFSGVWDVFDPQRTSALHIPPRYTSIQIQTHRIGYKPMTVVHQLGGE